MKPKALTIRFATGCLARGRGRVLAGLAVLVCTLALAAWVDEGLNRGGRWSGSGSSQLTGKPERPPGLWYLRTHQWRADARTAAAMLRYLLESEPATPAQPLVRIRTVELAGPTNVATVPRV